MLGQILTQDTALASDVDLPKSFRSHFGSSLWLAQAIGSRVTATDSDSVLLEGVGVSSQLKLADLIGRELL